MLETILRTAKEAGYEQAELEVIADNKNAIALYEIMAYLKESQPLICFQIICIWIIALQSFDVCLPAR